MCLTYHLPRGSGNDACRLSGWCRLFWLVVRRQGPSRQNPTSLRENPTTQAANVPYIGESPGPRFRMASVKPKVGGSQVWSRATDNGKAGSRASPPPPSRKEASASEAPPERGWKVPWDGDAPDGLLCVGPSKLSSSRESCSVSWLALRSRFSMPAWRSRFQQAALRPLRYHPRQ